VAKGRMHKEKMIMVNIPIGQTGISNRKTRMDRKILIDL
jgi:hypothetical protein